MPDGPDRVLQVREFTIDPRQSPERIDRYLSVKIAGASRNKVQEAIATGAVTVNGRPTRANYKVKPGDHIRVEVMRQPPIELIPEDIPIEILYEDDEVLVVVKPVGMVTHPGLGNRTGTLVNAVLYHVGASLLEVGPGGDYESEDEVSDEGRRDDDESGPSQEASPEENDLEGFEAEPFDYDAVRPGVVHRLDKDTSGVMVVAKTMQAKLALGEQFEKRTIRREYRAVAWGVFDQDEGSIEGNIARDPRDRKRFAVSKRDGKYALTHYRVIDRFDIATLLSLRLATGRTHQIRVHCAHIGHPLIGDATYGGAVPRVSTRTGRTKAERALRSIGRQALHARLLGFIHPVTGTYMEFVAEMPEDMQRLVFELKR